MILKMKNIEKRFEGLEVLKDISFGVDHGEVVSIIGPSGSGKSTLLRCATFLETIDGGEIIYMGETAAHTGADGVAVYASPQELKHFRSYCGLVFQQFNLFPHYSILKNITDAPIHVQHVSKDEAEATAMELLGKMGIADKANAYPYQLSGGQQQRVAIARALVNRPSVILADEPTGNLDSYSSIEIMGIFQGLNKQGISIILITHEPDIAQYSQRVVRVSDGEIVADSRVENPLLALEEIKKHKKPGSEED